MNHTQLSPASCFAVSWARTRRTIIAQIPIIAHIPTVLVTVEEGVEEGAMVIDAPQVFDTAETLYELAAVMHIDDEERVFQTDI